MQHMLKVEKTLKIEPNHIFGPHLTSPPTHPPMHSSPAPVWDSAALSAKTPAKESSPQLQWKEFSSDIASHGSTNPRQEVEEKDLQLQLNEKGSKIVISESTMAAQKVMDFVAPQADTPSKQKTLIDGIYVLIDKLSNSATLLSKSAKAKVGKLTLMNIDIALKVVILFLILKLVISWLGRMGRVMNTQENSVANPVDAEPEATSKEAQSFWCKPHHPDFSGNWLMTSYEGDADQFLYDVGYGREARTQAISLGMGSNKIQSEIVHHVAANMMSCVSTAQGKQSTAHLKINGKEQHYFNAEGESQWIVPLWIEDGQKIKGSIRDEKGPLPTVERWLASPTEMRVRLTTSKGSFFDQIFTKQ